MSPRDREPVYEWMFVAEDLPGWPVGSRWWGAALDDTHAAFPHSLLFVASTFLPADPPDADMLWNWASAVDQPWRLHPANYR